MLKIKNGFLIIFLFLSGASCNNNNENTSQKNPEPNSKENLKKLIKIYPDSLMLVQSLIEGYRDDAFYDSALALTDYEIKKDSGNAYLWNMKATLLFENNDTAAAIKSLEHAVNIYPLPEYLIALGTIYAEVKDTHSLTIANDLLKVNRTKWGKDALFLKGLFYNNSNILTA